MSHPVPFPDGPRRFSPLVPPPDPWWKRLWRRIFG